MAVGPVTDSEGATTDVGIRGSGGQETDDALAADQGARRRRSDGSSPGEKDGASDAYPTNRV